MLLVWPLGTYHEAEFSGRGTFAKRVLGPLERAIDRLCRIDPAFEMTCPTYAFTVLASMVTGIALAYVVLRARVPAIAGSI
jgi:potassium-transporting ATPase potassium-binding subunit